MVRLTSAYRKAVLATWWLMTSAGAVGAVVFSRLDGRHRLLYLVFGGSSAALAVLGNSVNHVRASRAQRARVDARSRSIFAFRSALSPAVFYLGKIADGESKAEEAEHLRHFIQAVVTAASTLCRAPAAHSIFFRIDGDRVSCAACADRGRRGKKSETTCRNDDDAVGKYFLGLAESRKSVLYSDITIGRDAPPRLPTDRQYRTFIAVPVVGSKNPYGVLTVDSPKPGSLGYGDLAIVKTLAGLLGVGLALTSEGGPDGTTDDSRDKAAHHSSAAHVEPLVDINSLRWIEEDRASFDAEFYGSGIKNAVVETFSDIARDRTARLYGALVKMRRIRPFKKRVSRC